MPDARTLYQISLLKAKLFSMALDEGMIHPRVTAEEIEQWRKRKLRVPDCLPVKLTIRPKKSLKPKDEEDDPDEEARDELIGQFRRAMDAIGFHVSDRNVHDPH
jgi:hypothetical protein